VRRVIEHTPVIEIGNFEGIPLHAHAVVGEDWSVLIDSGVAELQEEFAALCRDLAKGGQPIRILANTHAHHDHIGCNRTVQRESGCLIMAPRGAEPWIEDMETNYREFALLHPDVHPDSEEQRREILASMEGPTHVDGALVEGMVLRPDGIELEVIEVPGHIRYEAAFLERRSQTLILGDVIVGTDWGLFPGHVRPSLLRGSLDKVRRLLDEGRAKLVLASHYPAMTPDEACARIEGVERYLSDIDSRIRDALSRRKAGAAHADIWAHVCDAMCKQREFRSAAMIRAHLEDMAERGEAESIPSADGSERWRLRR